MDGTRRKDKPKIKVLQTLPEKSRRDRLAIMHIALTRIFPNDSVDHNLLFLFVKPPVLAAEPAGGVARPGGHESEGEDADD